MDLGTVEELVAPRDRAELPAFAAGDLLLAGGTWVFSDPQVGARRLIDLTALAWPSLVDVPGGLEIAATCTLAELAAAPVPTGRPALELARFCCDALRGSFKIWNAATVGGNLCLALVAAPMVAFVAALEGTCTVWTPGGGERELAAVDLVVGPGQTCLEDGEILRSITLPEAALASRTAVRQVSLTTYGRSAALLVGRIDAAAQQLVVTVTASTPHPVQLRLPADVSAEGLRAAIAERLGPGDYYDDVHGDPAWRQHLTGLLAEEIRQELAAS
ncbi:MAG: FAD binding domain-containing protein [Solirubrobacteraceae bacterium]|nr:FAD binding domain-containing protein [Solirubrobacteraceae bacterium]